MTHTIEPGNPEAPTTPPEALPTGQPAVAAGVVPAALKRRVPKYADLAPLMQFK
jgi:L-lactate dehydrogenase (cytochrome)